MQMKYLLKGTLVAKDGEREKLSDIMKRASALMLEKATGCELYELSYNDDEPNTIFITEIWADKEAHQASLKIEEVRELINEAMPILADMQLDIKN